MKPTLAATGAAAALAVLPSIAAQANDRDLRATVVNAYSCVEDESENDGAPGIAGAQFLWGGSGKKSILYCPLPINNIDLGGTTNDNDMTSFSVLYRDPDGFGLDYHVEVYMLESSLNGSGNLSQFVVCDWDSSGDGTGASAWVRQQVPCAHDFSAVNSYHFAVVLSSSAASAANQHVGFGGIRFP